MIDLVSYFAERRGIILDMVRQMVEVESPSLDKRAVDRMAELMVHMAEQAGGRVSLERREDGGNHVVARWGGEGPGFLVLSHIDTVFPVGTLAERPWCVEGNEAFGPGAYDTKSGAAITLSALSGLADLGVALKYPVTAIFNSDEEIGTLSSRALIKEEAAKARVVLVMEPGDPPDGALKIWRKGVGIFTVTAIGRSAHAGAAHRQGINAIEEVAHQILKIQAMTDYELGMTTSVDVVRGGQRTNVVPDRAQIQVDVRVTTKAEGERMAAAFKGLQPVLPGARLIVEGGMNRPPMEDSDVTRGPFNRACEIGAELGMALTGRGTGGGSDGNFTAAMGVPTLDGLGAEGGGAHTEGEYIVIDSLPRRAALVAALLSRW
ncbi:MAG: M20 family metallopeptidase [Anaerolineae bacterium]|nr:M20 family metallopeptidase [Anaerolineae bacterium]